MTPTPRRFDHSGLQILDDGESLELLSSVPIGRLVFTKGGLPAVRLVNFVLDGDSLIFATADGDKYRAAERGDVVAFEVDAVDEDRHLGWTVTAAGHLSVIDPDEAESLRHGLPLRPWAPQHDSYLIRLGIESLEGRRLVPWAQRPHDQAAGKGAG
ncbi:pyridoxamine 5'-phosphate oxidase-like protein [Kribbella orskensis]|uniref:Pyridoxamine 5'-phosphate oxidase-like protein n=1 Tax=Kribbella orskensis TaxID=2512216 RepID=A0ABY2BNT0_9ACTN|nr:MULTISPECIES: pyridoxamine 5'-phosphate oxidase family protein [Kribbella]TCN42211.1 pyridoxamine 5'-phosphate oxidase-like protein [Kribbella sp. VKM Ac-2500]TCO26089.1 pyridoxamine 5'-phosphate oxidase-like protein [Kribbella orskensis]